MSRVYSMTKSTKTDLKIRTLMAVRDYGIQLTLFRNAMSEWAGLNVTDMECLRLGTSCMNTQVERAFFYLA